MSELVDVWVISQIVAAVAATTAAVVSYLRLARPWYSNNRRFRDAVRKIEERDRR